MNTHTTERVDGDTASYTVDKLDVKDGKLSASVRHFTRRARGDDFVSVYLHPVNEDKPRSVEVNDHLGQTCVSVGNIQLWLTPAEFELLSLAMDNHIYPYALR